MDRIPIDKTLGTTGPNPAPGTSSDKPKSAGKAKSGDKYDISSMLNQFEDQLRALKQVNDKIGVPEGSRTAPSRDDVQDGLDEQQIELDRQQVWIDEARAKLEQDQRAFHFRVSAFEAESDRLNAQRRQLEKLLAELDDREAQLEDRIQQIQRAAESLARITHTIHAERDTLAPFTANSTDPLSGNFDLRKAA